MAWFTVLLLLMAGGCTQAPARDPAVVQDLLTYIEKIQKWEPVEVKVLNAISDVRRSHYADDDYVVATLGGIMDEVELHLEEIRRYQPRTAPVIEVHERYRTAWSDLHESFTTIIGAMQEKDYMRLSHGTEAMGRSRGELVTVAAALSRLLAETGIEPDRGGNAPS